MKTILAMIFAWTSSWAQNPTARAFSIDELSYNQGTRPGQFALGYKDYQDIRIDSDLDGKIDFWYLKKGLLEVGIKYNSGNISYVYIKKSISANQISEATLIPNSAGNLALLSKITRSAETMNGMAPEDKCPTAKKSDASEIADVSKAIAGELDAIVDSYVDESCLGENIGFTRTLQTALKEVVADGGTNDPNSFHQCIQSKTTKDALGGSEKTTPALDLLSTKLGLDLSTMAKTKSEKPLFICEFDKATTTPSAKYQENGTIVFKLPAGPRLGGVRPEGLKRLLRHELLHRAGLKEEEPTDKLASICPIDPNKPPKRYISSDNVGHAFALVPANVEQAASKASGGQDADTSAKAEKVTARSSSRGPASESRGGSADVDMKKEIASAKAIPSAEKLAATKTDKSPEGTKRAVEESVATSTPVLRMANQVMGASNTQAIASDSSQEEELTYTRSSAGGGSRSASSASDSSSPSTASTYTSSGDDREIASSSSSKRYQARNGRYESKSDSSSSSGGLRAGERVVEEIDLTKNSRSTSRAAAPAQQEVDRSMTSVPVTQSATRSNSRSPASLPAAVPANASGSASDIAGAGGNGGGGSTGSSLSGSSSFGSNDEPVRRNANGTRSASRSSGSAASASTSRDEVVTFLSNSDYSATKRKLRDTGFVTTLKENKVTVVDLYGNSFGANKGEVIFLDQGDKFTRQK